MLIVVGCKNDIKKIDVNEAVFENDVEMKTYFCPKDDCEEVLIENVGKAENSVHCAYTMSSRAYCANEKMNFNRYSIHKSHTESEKNFQTKESEPQPQTSAKASLRLNEPGGDHTNLGDSSFENMYVSRSMPKSVVTIDFLRMSA